MVSADAAHAGDGDRGLAQTGLIVRGEEAEIAAEGLSVVKRAVRRHSWAL